MSQLKSKQISDFSQTVDWNNALLTEIPSSSSIKDQFIAKDQLAVDSFTGSYPSGSGTWSVVLSDDVLNDDPELVTIYVNGVKTNGVSSVNGNTIIVEQYGYDIDFNDGDILKVHYVREY
jgi:hypothetical protein